MNDEKTLQFQPSKLNCKSYFIPLHFSFALHNERRNCKLWSEEERILVKISFISILLLVYTIKEFCSRSE